MSCRVVFFIVFRLSLSLSLSGRRHFPLLVLSLIEMTFRMRHEMNSSPLTMCVCARAYMINHSQFSFHSCWTRGVHARSTSSQDRIAIRFAFDAESISVCVNLSIYTHTHRSAYKRERIRHLTGTYPHMSSDVLGTATRRTCAIVRFSAECLSQD